MQSRAWHVAGLVGFVGWVPVLCSVDLAARLAYAGMQSGAIAALFLMPKRVGRARPRESASTATNRQETRTDDPDARPAGTSADPDTTASAANPQARPEQIVHTAELQLDQAPEEPTGSARVIRSDRVVSNGS